MILTSFPPQSTPHATHLILGSMPGVLSLQRQQYYAHPQNAFWPIMMVICGASPRLRHVDDLSLSYTERLTYLQRNQIALWDVLQHCEREGSLDANIKKQSEVPNNFVSFLAQHEHVRYLFFNGQKAAHSFNKLVWPCLDAAQQQRFTRQILPSTSPAHASLSREKKLDLWAEAFKNCVTI